VTEVGGVGRVESFLATLGAGVGVVVRARFGADWWWVGAWAGRPLGVVRRGGSFRELLLSPASASPCKAGCQRSTRPSGTC
jgi:hypothetical protein